MIRWRALGCCRLELAGLGALLIVYMLSNGSVYLRGSSCRYARVCVGDEAMVGR